ncbi:MAG TPA: hypothetical protein VN697_00145 [Tepidiformaceae bacterium]|nr:hypothetical protein [Tepidiformaceae bacterium]
MPRRFLTSVIGSLALLAVPILGGCGGSSSPAQAFDPKNASQVTHAALIAPSDLPGTWTAARNDQFTDTSNASAIAASAACKASDAAFTKATNARSVGRASRAEVFLSGTPPAASTAAPGSPAATPSGPAASASAVTGTASATASATPGAAAETVAPTIEETVEVYQDESVPAVALPLLRQALASDDVQQCRADTVKAQYLANFPDVAVMATAFAPSNQSVAATPDGFASAFALAITSGQGELRLNFQTYGWRSGNAIVTLSFFGPPDQLTGALVNAAVQKAQSKLAAAK